MGKSLPILNIPSLPGALGSFQQQITQFFTPRTQGNGAVRRPDGRRL